MERKNTRCLWFKSRTMHTVKEKGNATHSYSTSSMYKYLLLLSNSSRADNVPQSNCHWHQPRPKKIEGKRRKKTEEMKKCLNIATPLGHWEGGRAAVWLKWITFIHSQLLTTRVRACVCEWVLPLLLFSLTATVSTVFHHGATSMGRVAFVLREAQGLAFSATCTVVEFTRMLHQFTPAKRDLL